MIRITFIEPDGRERNIEVRTGISLMEAAIQNDIAGIDALCGGACSCGTCLVHIDPIWINRLTAPERTEFEMLDALELDEPGIRLSCQIHLDEAFESLVVRVSSEN
jgi:2Fe-2S ferredoxin